MEARVRERKAASPVPRAPDRRVSITDSDDDELADTETGLLSRCPVCGEDNRLAPPLGSRFERKPRPSYDALILATRCASCRRAYEVEPLGWRLRKLTPQEREDQLGREFRETYERALAERRERT